MNDDYPVQFSVEYGDGRRNRLTTLFRLIMIIPIAIMTGLLGSAGYIVIAGSTEDQNYTIPGITLGILLMILFRKKYPRWVFDFLLESSRFGARVGAYVALLVDQYPSTDEHQSVHLDIAYPDANTEINRFLPLVKWLLAIPHYIILIILAVVAVVLVFIAWWAIIITGKYPRFIFDYVEGVSRWGYRVSAYAFLLVTDRYPPFSLK